MKTTDFIEEVLDIKLFDFQKAYLDYLDRYPNTKIVLPRGITRITTFDLWVLAQIAKENN